jgi:hypothetical protein
MDLWPLVLSRKNLTFNASNACKATTVWQARALLARISSAVKIGTLEKITLHPQFLQSFTYEENAGTTLYGNSDCFIIEGIRKAV